MWKNSTSTKSHSRFSIPNVVSIRLGSEYNPGRQQRRNFGPQGSPEGERKEERGGVKQPPPPTMLLCHLLFSGLLCCVAAAAAVALWPKMLQTKKRERERNSLSVSPSLSLSVVVVKRKDPLPPISRQKKRKFWDPPPKKKRKEENDRESVSNWKRKLSPWFFFPDRCVFSPLRTSDDSVLTAGCREVISHSL